MSRSRRINRRAGYYHAADAQRSFALASFLVFAVTGAKSSKSTPIGFSDGVERIYIDVNVATIPIMAASKTIQCLTRLIHSRRTAMERGMRRILQRRKKQKLHFMSLPAAKPQILFTHGCQGF